MKFIALLIFLSIATFAQDKPKKIFSNESSLSIVQTGGNAVSESYNAETVNKYKPGTREYKVYGNYTLSYADDPQVEGIDTEETARNWQVGAATTLDITEKIGLNTGIMYEGNEFTGYKQRENFDLGTKYTFYESDHIKSYADFGYRYVIEKRTTRNEDNEDIFYFNKANINHTLEHVLNESVSYMFWFQYLPNFTVPDDYQINFEASLNVIMSNMFSLKVAYKGAYDNELNPGVREYLDRTTTTSLVARF